MRFPAARANLLSLLCGAACAACGDDGPAADAAGPDAADISDLFPGPETFDRIGCAPGSLAGFTPAGTWHHDFRDADFGPFAGLVRYEGTAPVYTAWVNLGVTTGRDTSDVRLTDDDLFVRVFYTNDDGAQRLRVFDACALDAGGHLLGKWAICNQEWGGDCFIGTFEGVKVERLPGESESQGFTLLGEWAGPPAAPWPVSGREITANVRTLDGVAYAARFADGLRIVDLNDPAAPVELGWSAPAMAANTEIYNDVKLVVAGGKSFALMASNVRGIVALDVTDPSQPVEVSAFPPIPDGQDHLNVHTLFVETVGGVTRAYLANIFTRGIDIWNVTNPALPLRIGGYVHSEVANDPSALVHDLYVENGRAYLSYWSLGLVIIDTLADPEDPILVGTFDAYDRRTNHSVWVTTAGGKKIALTGDEDFGAHLRVVDVDPASGTFLQELGALSLRPEVSIHNIMAFGDLGYVAWYQDGARLVDVSDPTQPTLAGYFNTWSPPGDGFYEGAIGIDVDLSAGRVYVADTERGILVLSAP